MSHFSVFAVFAVSPFENVAMRDSLYRVCFFLSRVSVLLSVCYLTWNVEVCCPCQGALMVQRNTNTLKTLSPDVQSEFIDQPSIRIWGICTPHHTTLHCSLGNLRSSICCRPWERAEVQHLILSNRRHTHTHTLFKRGQKWDHHTVHHLIPPTTSYSPSLILWEQIPVSIRLLADYATTACSIWVFEGRVYCWWTARARQLGMAWF